MWVKSSGVKILYLTEKQIMQEQVWSGDHENQEFTFAYQKFDLQITHLAKMHKGNVNIHIWNLEEGNYLKV